MNKKLLKQICEKDHERVEKIIDNQIVKLNQMKLLSKVISFVHGFSQHLAGEKRFSDLREHYGKTIKLSLGYEQNRFPQGSSMFYTLDGHKDSFIIEDGSEFLDLLKFADERKIGFSNEMVIDAAFMPKLIALVLGDNILEKYLETCMEMHISI